MIFKVFPHLMLNKTHLITGSSKIISSENLAEKTYFLVPHFLYTQLYLTPLEHFWLVFFYSFKKQMLQADNTDRLAELGTFGILEFFQ